MRVEVEGVTTTRSLQGVTCTERAAASQTRISLEASPDAIIFPQGEYATCLSRAPFYSLFSLSDQSRCQANMAHVKQSKPDSGLGFQVKVLKTFQVAPCSLRCGADEDFLGRNPGHDHFPAGRVRNLFERCAKVRIRF